MKYQQVIPISLLILTLFLDCNRPAQRDDNGASQQRPESVEAVIVTRGILNPYLEKAGIVSGINEAIIVSETEGIIRTVTFDIGDDLDSGAQLLEVDRTETRFSMNQARQQLDVATMNLNASERLYGDSAISRSEYEQARSSYNGARATYESAARRFRNTQVRSPIRGQVASKENGITVGNYLSPGMPVGRIADLSGLRLELSLGEGEINLVETGAEATVRVHSVVSDSVFQATVRAVASGADPASGSYQVIIAWENNGSQVRSGMSATARIRTTDTDSVLLIPTAALLQESDSSSVLQVNGGRVQEKEVLVGRRLGNNAEIRAGLTRGDTVAITRTRSLAQGDSVDLTIVAQSGAWQ